VARIEVPMPQMGESIAEGTVSKWLKKVGDTVERDEPILEISTDKVDAEIPAPQSGVLVEVEVEEGETVEVGTIVAYIDTDASAAADPSTDTDADAEEAEAATEEPVKESESEDEDGAEERMAVEASGEEAGESEKEAAGGEETAEERLRTRSTPVVRRIAAEHGIDISDISGSGHAGRVTKQDILDFIESGAPAGGVVEKDEPADETVQKPAAKTPVPGEPVREPATMDGGDLWKKFYAEVEHPEFPVREGDDVEPMDKIRRLTAEHMVIAKRVAPHVHSFIEIDFSRVDEIRRQKKQAWADQGARVSYTAFVTWACSRLLRDYPSINGTVSGNNIIHRGAVNIGMAVDLDPGLIVPVMHDTDHLSLVGIGKKIIDLAERARDRKLSPGEIQGATFSITNPGVLGTIVGMPVIPKGTAAILGTGAIEKRPVVVEDPVTGADSIAIRKRAYFSMGYDHRLVDGADAARFLADLKEMLEDFPEDA